MARVTIKLELNGETIDEAIADMPDQALQLAIDAMCNHYQYQENIANPDYDSLVEDSPKTIPNPVSKARFFSFQLRKFAEGHAEAYFTEQKKEQATREANQLFGNLNNVSVQ